MSELQILMVLKIDLFMQKFIFSLSNFELVMWHIFMIPEWHVWQTDK